MNINIIIYDRQGITRLGVEALIKRCLTLRHYNISVIDGKAELIAQLTTHPDSLVVMDYTLSDFNSVDGLLNISTRFEDTRWILFSEELSLSFLKKITMCSHSFSIVLKNADIKEIETAILETSNKEVFICSQIKNLLSINESKSDDSDIALTATEKEILKEIAWGKTAKEIAADRNISVYTVVTHRKNIYRKLGVNNSQEASRYALRAGIVDASDYYI